MPPPGSAAPSCQRAGEGRVPRLVHLRVMPAASPARTVLAEPVPDTTGNLANRPMPASRPGRWQMNATTVARSVPVQRGQQADPVTEMPAQWAARFEQKALPYLVQLDPTALCMTRHRGCRRSGPGTLARAYASPVPAIGAASGVARDGFRCVFLAVTPPRRDGRNVTPCPVRSLAAHRGRSRPGGPRAVGPVRSALAVRSHVSARSDITGR